MGLAVTLYRMKISLLEEVNKGHSHPLKVATGLENISFDYAFSNASVAPLSLCFSKYWNVILFLISEEYRRLQPIPAWQFDYKSPCSWAVVGAHQCAPSGDWGLNYPLRCSSSEEVGKILSCIETIGKDDILGTLETVKGVAMPSTYGLYLLRDNEIDPEAYTNSLDAMKLFYQTAYWEDKAVLCILR